MPRLRTIPPLKNAWRFLIEQFRAAPHKIVVHKILDRP
jgi:hypothetical protein